MSVRRRARCVAELAVVGACLSVSRSGLTHRVASAQGGTGWTADVMVAGPSGAHGARWLSLAAGDTSAALQHDGNLDPAGANADGNPEVFLWRDVPSIAQLTVTTGGSGSPSAQAGSVVDGTGNAVAFVSVADPAGRNADASPEVFLWRSSAPMLQLSDASGASAEVGDLSADGRVAAFWHSGDLTGENPDGSLELYRATAGGGVAQLTDLGGSPFHSRPSISADGEAIAFILEAEITGGNADGSWELFVWRGPPSTPGDRARFTQATDWHPPMTGRDIQAPSTSGDGRRVAFIGRGQVDASLPDAHTTMEIYLWERGATLRRLTSATQPNLSSTMPRISDDGSHIAFVSLSDLAPGAPGNANRNAELFVWSECEGIAQVTDSTGRPSVILTDASASPDADGDGDHLSLISERQDDIGPLVLGSRRGVPVRLRELAGSPCGPPAPTLTPTLAGPTPTVGTRETPTPATARPTPASGPLACPQLLGRVPAAIIASALANPAAVYGWNLPANPSLPPGLRNPPRRWLSLRDIGKPYSPANPVVWKAGCP